MKIRGTCHVCGTRMELSVPSPAPVVCTRRACGTAVRAERRLAVTLASAPSWSGIADLARATGLSPVAVTRVLRRLEHHGWVETRLVEHRRRGWFRRTPRDYRLSRAGVQAVRWIHGRGG
ncbi:helix-turn-helix domain-containing protein [Pseudonocardia sp. HH130630-07]|uniref:helix-turn-helix domain-containing protein n=1 Tax=Pseudonocardia sp. HH130630-07 TaxID=1690815 RepID=UPI003FA6EAAF